MSSGSSSEDAALQGVAAVAVTVAEMGGTEADIVRAVAPYLEGLGLVSASDVRRIARVVPQLPQPLDEGAEAKERRAHVDEMLGVTSAEDQLLASMRAVEALQRLADRIESTGPSDDFD